MKFKELLKNSKPITAAEVQELRSKAKKYAKSGGNYLDKQKTKSIFLMFFLCIGCVNNEEIERHKIREYIMIYHEKEREKSQYYLKKVKENISNRDTLLLYKDSLHMALYAQKSYANSWINAQ